MLDILLWCLGVVVAAVMLVLLIFVAATWAFYRDIKRHRQFNLGGE